MTETPGRIDRVEAALRASEERFHLAMKALQGVVWDRDVRTGHVYRSEGLYDLIGVRPEDAEPTVAWWDDRIHPEDRAPVAPTETAASGAGELHSHDYRVRHADGRWIDVWSRAVRERDASGQVVRVVGFTADVSDRKRAERALQDADRRKNEFLATLAHELRNPLAPILIGLDVIKQSPPTTPASARAREMMDRQLGHLVRLVDDLLDVSRISSGKLELKRERLEVRAVVDLAVEASRPLVEAARHALTVRVPDEPVWLDGDRCRLAQVVSNLLNNAAKYTPKGGRIHLSATTEGGAAVLRVTDDGAGFSAAMLPRLFGLFAQLDQTRGQAQGGLGIGLSLARKLTEMHGGAIEAESPGEGRGSTFTVRLPLSAAAGPPARSPRRAAPAPPAPRRILVVDDNMDGAETLALVLGFAGHQTRTAFDGPEALVTAREFSPEVVFLDIGLPGMDGYEVARRLRADVGLAGATLVALTGWGGEDDKRRAEEAGFDFHLTKPVEARAVEDVLARVRVVPQRKAG